MISGIISKDEKVKQIKSNDAFKNLRSDFFLRTTFDLMNKKKSLEIVKNNKNLQKRLNISIDDYKEYSQPHSSIEIELKFLDYRSGKFINIPKEDKKYYHIYFDKSKEEIKRNYLKKKKKLK